MEKVYAWRVTKAKIYLTDEKKELKDIRDSWIFQKVRLKAAKSVSGKWISLKFVRETGTKSLYLSSKVTLAQLFTSFYVVTKRRNDLQQVHRSRKIQQPPTNTRINTHIKKATSVKNRQSRTLCSYFCRREKKKKNRNGLACNPDKREVDHLCSCFHSITVPSIDWGWWLS